MGKRQDNRDEKRKLIVDSARRLMQARATSDFSMRTLADVAGVSSATPYSLFGSKQAVIAAVMDTDFDNFTSALSAKPVIGLDIFFHMVDITVELFAANPGYYKKGALAIQAASDKALASHFGLPRHGLLRDFVRDAIQRGDINHRINADSFALTLGHQFYGWIQAWANGDIKLDDLSNRAKYGMSMALAAAATADVRDALMVQLLNFQDALPEAGAMAAIQTTAAMTTSANKKTTTNLSNNNSVKEALG
ncbi:MAG: TetR/AcrR family transcriptional regulator [Pseudomonadales bacterium]|nr:TetR/AcrR family transcriptional regulator [Pseudomonadales bacterium]MDG1441775.1 TetR/AcrR family transcriptional regulator [Pseudomonadales bacterium]